jgi:uncharacterized protein involved in outer membrane biogenesis
MPFGAAGGYRVIIMRWFFRWLFRILILLVVLAIAALLLLDTIARELTRRHLEKQTGLEVKIGRMQVGLLDPRVTLENVVVYNNAQFGGSPLMELPELHLEYDRCPWFGAKVHFKLIRLNLAKLNVVRDKNGKKNLDVMSRHWKKADGDSDSKGGSGNQKSKGSKTNEFPGIDTLNVTLGRATYMEMKDPGKVEELKVEIHNQVYTNVKTQGDVDSILLVVLLKSEGNILGNGGSSVNWLEVFGLTKKKNPPVKSSP